MTNRITDIFTTLGSKLPPADKGLRVTTPATGATIAELPADTESSLDQKIKLARAAQSKWSMLKRTERIAFLEKLSAAIKTQRAALAELITLEGGKTLKEAFAETDGSADIILKTIKDATLPELNNMLRTKERPAVGAVGLITSFNFPLVVAHWTLAPALLAANAVLWKPSEKTPLVALAYKIIFDSTMHEHKDLLQIIIGEREIGQALVAHDSIDMISATGSVAMGQGIKKTLAQKKNNAIKPILELGGNNAAILSDKLSPDHLAWSLTALMNSFLGTTGQRCTNTRRLIVHQKIYDQTIAQLKQKIQTFLTDPKNGEEYGYGPLIDQDAFNRFEQAKKRASTEGGKILFGARLEKETPAAYYVEPALALMPTQTKIMHEETFAPLLFITSYENFDDAIALVNAPANAGLTNAIYTQNQHEADHFAAKNQAGHTVINSPKGTNTPAHNMGFGGNKDSGTGEILNAADPLRPFTREETFSRIAQNKDIKMDL